MHVLSAEHDTTSPAPPPPHVPTQIEATGSECSAHECVGLTEADDVDAGSSRAARHQTLTTVSSPPVTSTALMKGGGWSLVSRMRVIICRRRRELVVGSARVLTEVVFAEFAQAAATARRRPDVVRRGNEWSEEGPIRC